MSNKGVFADVGDEIYSVTLQLMDIVRNGENMDEVKVLMGHLDDIKKKMDKTLDLAAQLKNDVKQLNEEIGKYKTGNKNNRITNIQTD